MRGADQRVSERAVEGAHAEQRAGRREKPETVPRGLRMRALVRDPRPVRTHVPVRLDVAKVAVPAQGRDGHHNQADQTGHHQGQEHAQRSFVAKGVVRTRHPSLD